jgi:lysophospholipase L1-like esterase
MERNQKLAERNSERLMKKTQASPVKKLVYLLVLFIAVLLLAELVTSVFYYHQYGQRKLALAELFYSVKTTAKLKKEAAEQKQKNYYNQQLVRPDSSKQMTRQVFDETMASNHFIYEPWVEFRNADFKGRYVNTKGFIRKSIPDFVQKQSSDTITVWFFGGSTMFGFNVADFETIPSQFAKLYHDSSKYSASLRIINFGIPYYFSYQEYKLFSLLLEKNQPPDYAVFFNGLNDFWSYHNTYYNQPYFSDRLSSMMQKNVFEFLPSEPGNIYRLKDTALSEKQCDTLLNNYLKNLSRIEEHAARKQVTTLFVLQPVPFYGYRNQLTDPVCTKKQYRFFNYIYPMLEQEFQQKNNYLFLGNLLASAPALPFIDAIHYSPQFNKKIALEILQTILK